MQFRPEHLFRPDAADDAIAVFPAHGAAEFLDQVADFLADGQHFVNAGIAFQADQGADVQAAHAGMAVIAGLGVVITDDFVKAADELSQVFRIHGRIFDKGNRLGVAVNAHQQPQAALADIPNHILVGFRQQVDAGIAQPLPLHIGFQGGHFAGQFPLRFPIELDQQHRPGIPLHKGQVAGLAHRFPGAGQHHIIQHFHRGGAVFQHFLSGFAGLENVPEMQHGQRGHRRPRHQIDFGIGDHAESSLGTRHHFAQVDRLLAQERVQVVAADPAHNLGIAGLDFRQILPGNPQNAAVNIRFQPLAIQLGGQFVGFQGAEMGRGGVGQNHIHFLNVV